MYINKTYQDYFIPYSQFMLLLTSRQLPKLLLRDTTQEAIQTHERLDAILTIQNLPFRTPHKLLNLQQTRLIKMRTEAILNLLKNLAQKTRRVITLARGGTDNLIHEASRNEFVTGNPLAHYKRFISLGDTESLDEGAAGAAFGYQTQ